MSTNHHLATDRLAAQRHSLCRQSTVGFPHGNREGAVLVGVLACLVVCTAITALTLQSALRGRREARLERQLMQTQLLCEAGVLRATRAVQSSSEYRGETWRPQLVDSIYHAAEVEISVTPESNQASSAAVQIIAKLDSTTDSDGPMQRSTTFSIPTVSKPTLASSTTEIP